MAPIPPSIILMALYPHQYSLFIPSLTPSIHYLIVYSYGAIEYSYGAGEHQMRMILK